MTRCCALLVVVLLALLPGLASSDSGLPFELVEEGPLLPDFAFEELSADGSKRDWGFIELRGKPVVVVLWATWCGVCAGELPKLDALESEIGDRALIALLSIDKQGVEHAGRALKRRGFENLRVFHDTKSMFFASIGAHGVPTSVVADANGQIVARASGPVAWDSPDVRRFLEKLARSDAETTASR